jgi:hypothetical protein
MSRIAFDGHHLVSWGNGRFLPHKEPRHFRLSRRLLVKVVVSELPGSSYPPPFQIHLPLTRKNLLENRSPPLSLLRTSRTGFSLVLHQYRGLVEWPHYC